MNSETDPIPHSGCFSIWSVMTFHSPLSILMVTRSSVTAFFFLPGMHSLRTPNHCIQGSVRIRGDSHGEYRLMPFIRHSLSKEAAKLFVSQMEYRFRGY